MKLFYDPKSHSPQSSIGNERAFQHPSLRHGPLGVGRREGSVAEDPYAIREGSVGSIYSSRDSEDPGAAADLRASQVTFARTGGGGDRGVRGGT